MYWWFKIKCVRSIAYFVCFCIHLYLFACHREWFECHTVSHKRFTGYSHLTFLMTKPVLLVTQPDSITKSTQVYVCVCMCLCKTWPRGIQLTCHCGKVLLGLISVFLVCPTQVKTVDPAVWLGWVKAYWDRLRWCTEPGSESMLAWGEPLRWSLTVSQNLSDSLQTKGSSHCTQFRHSGKETISLFCLCLQWNKKKNKSVLTSSASTRSK